MAPDDISLILDTHNMTSSSSKAHAVLIIDLVMVLGDFLELSVHRASKAISGRD